MTPPMTPEPVAATGRRAVCCVVYGQPTVVMADPARPLDAVLAVALEQTGNVARPLVDWEIRDAQGTPLDRHRAVSSYDFPVDARLFLNLRAGYGGEGPEPVAAMTPERLAEIEAADARDRAADPMDIRAIPAPAEPMGHRTELLREVRQLTADRDAARAELAGLRQRVTELADSLEAATMPGGELAGRERAVLCGLPGGLRAMVRGAGDPAETCGEDPGGVLCDRPVVDGLCEEHGAVGPGWTTCESCDGTGGDGHGWCADCSRVGYVRVSASPDTVTEGVAP